LAVIDQLEVAGKPTTGMQDVWAVYEDPYNELRQGTLHP